MTTNDQTAKLITACSWAGFSTIDMGDHVRIVATDKDDDGTERERIANLNGFEHTGDGGGYTFQDPEDGNSHETTWIEVKAKA